jgi:toxin ParE1/3/4
MTAQFRLTKPAITDIEEIADYIARQSGLKKSEDFLSRLESRFANIVAFPQIGRTRDAEYFDGVLSYFLCVTGRRY